MEEKITLSIKDFTEHGSLCQWDVVIIRERKSGCVVQRKRCSTNSEGCGIYSDGKEIAKPEDFTLRSIESKQAKVKRYFTDTVLNDNHKAKKLEASKTLAAEVMRLRDEEKKTYQEIAKILDRSIGSIRWIVTRERRKK